METIKISFLHVFTIKTGTMIFTWVYYYDYYDYVYSCYTNEKDSISHTYKFVLLHETVSLRFHQLEPHARAKAAVKKNLVQKMHFFFCRIAWFYYHL